MNFTYLYKHKFASIDDFTDKESYDLFISTYNDSERTRITYEKVNAHNKIWLLLPEYENNIFFNKNNPFKNISYDDYTILANIIDEIIMKSDLSICIDITGFLTHHLFFILRYLQKVQKIKKIDAIYTEAIKYKQAELTVFSDSFYDVVQIPGYEGAHSANMNNDLLIIAAGYDDGRITDVANKKAKATKIQLLGFPSIQADMFQENIIRAHRAEAAIGSECFKNIDLNIYAPANDPFVTAQTLKEYLEKSQRNELFSNIYLAPISSKPHALGIALYYIWENGSNLPMSVIYPMCKAYYGNNADGISNVWNYKIELPID